MASISLHSGHAVHAKRLVAEQLTRCMACTKGVVPPGHDELPFVYINTLPMMITGSALNGLQVVSISMAKVCRDDGDVAFLGA